MNAPDEMPPEQEPAGEAPAENRLSPIYMRFVEVFFYPGKLAASLAANPVWVGALILGIVLMLAQTLAIPMDVWDQMMREAVLQRGGQVPASMGGSLFRISALIGGTVGYVIITLLFSGLVTLLFAFILGDEGRFKQYLSLVAHSWLIPLTVGLLLLPLKILQSNPQLTLNMGTFLFFLPKGYFLKLATAMDLSQAWAWLVVAQGAHAINPRRSFKAAVIPVMILFLVMSAIFAIWIPIPE